MLTFKLSLLLLFNMLLLLNQPFQSLLLLQAQEIRMTPMRIEELATVCCCARDSEENDPFTLTFSPSVELDQIEDENLPSSSDLPRGLLPGKTISLFPNCTREQCLRFQVQAEYQGTSAVCTILHRGHGTNTNTGSSEASEATKQVQVQPLVIFLLGRLAFEGPTEVRALSPSTFQCLVSEVSVFKPDDFHLYWKVDGKTVNTSTDNANTNTNTNTNTNNNTTTTNTTNDTSSNNTNNSTNTNNTTHQRINESSQGNQITETWGLLYRLNEDDPNKTITVYNFTSVLTTTALDVGLGGENGKNTILVQCGIWHAGLRLIEQQQQQQETGNGRYAISRDVTVLDTTAVAKPAKLSFLAAKNTPKEGSDARNDDGTGKDAGRKKKGKEEKTDLSVNKQKPKRTHVTIIVGVTIPLGIVMSLITLTVCNFWCRSRKRQALVRQHQQQNAREANQEAVSNAESSSHGGEETSTQNESSKHDNDAAN